MLRSLIASAAATVLLAIAAPAHSAVLIYQTHMSGVNEVPANPSLATGFTLVTIDTDLDTMLVDVSYNGVATPPGAAHIHCCTPVGTNIGVAVGFPGFPTSLSGAYSHLFSLLDSTIYTTSFLNNFGGGTAAGAEAALLAGLADGLAYSNIHNSVFPGGEIRGQLAAVPETGTWAMMILGFAALGATLRRRRAAFA